MDKMGNEEESSGRGDGNDYHPTTSCRSNSSIKNHNHHNLKVINIKYASYDSRVKSFRKWPKCVSKYQTENLCEAGLKLNVFTVVYVFQIGMTQKKDQHMIWSQNCPFLKMKKGTMCSRHQVPAAINKTKDTFQMTE